MAIRVPKFLTDLYKIARPDPGKLLGWGNNADVVNIQTGVAFFTGACPSDVQVGDFVYVAGAGRSVSKVDVFDFAKLPAIGCVTLKAAPTACVVQTAGLVSGLFSGLHIGATYYLGADGRPYLGPPTPTSGASLFLQAVGVALDDSTLILSPSLTVVRIRN